jgi:predicted metal-dependent hydrolase
MHSQIQLGDIAVDVIRKDIKNVHLSIHPPTGRVRIAAPERMSLDIVRVFAISKLGWIKRHQRKMREQERETPREYLDRESHYVWGRRCLLKVIEEDGPPKIILKHSSLIIRMHPGSSRDAKEAVLYKWYRDQIREAVPPLIRKWERLMQVTVEAFFVQKMKTKWGSCNQKRKTIRLNSELAKKPRECLEYIIVHEMVHLMERTHNERFRSLMDRFMPKWESCRDNLNRLPVGHEDWRY